MKLQVGVKACIKNSNDAYLFLRRSVQVSTDSAETSWDIPGGRIDPGEELVDALRREIREEIGCEISSTPQLIAAQDIIVATKDIHVVRLTYIIEQDVSPIVLSDEHDDYRWATLTQTKDMIIEPYLAEVIDGLR